MKLKIQRGKIASDMLSVRLGTLMPVFATKCQQQGLKMSEVIRTMVLAFNLGEIEIEAE